MAVNKIIINELFSIEMLGRCPILFSHIIYSIIPSSSALLSSLFIIGRSNQDIHLATRFLTRPYSLGFLRVTSTIEGYLPSRIA